MNYMTAKKQMQEGSIAPFYLWQDLDQVQKDHLLAIIQEQRPEAEWIRFPEEDLSSLMAEAESYSFLGEGKVIILEICTFLSTKTEVSKEEIEAFQSFSQHLPEEVILIFYCDGQKLDKRKQVTKQVLKQAVSVTQEEWKEKDWKNYVHQQIQNQGYVISEKNLQFLFQRLPQKRDEIKKELEKLFLYSTGEKEITKEAIDATIEPNLEEHLFAISDHLLERNVGEAIRIYRQLKVQGEDTIKMNYLLLMQIRLLLQVKILQEKGYSKEQMQKALGIHPYRIELAKRQTRQVSLKKLETMYRYAVEVEQALKSTGIDEDFLFELLLSRL